MAVAKFIQAGARHPFNRDIAAGSQIQDFGQASPVLHTLGNLQAKNIAPFGAQASQRQDCDRRWFLAFSIPEIIYLVLVRVGTGQWVSVGISVWVGWRVDVNEGV